MNGKLSPPAVSFLYTISGSGFFDDTFILSRRRREWNNKYHIIFRYYFVPTGDWNLQYAVKVSRYAPSKLVFKQKSSNDTSCDMCQ